jgi:hypothetical protein
MSLRIGFDIDGVVADFRSAFRAAARQSLRRDIAEARSASADASDALTPAEIERVWAYIGRTVNWWMEVAPYEPAEIARLYSLSRAALWEVFFLTKRPPSAGDTVQFQTQWWLEQHGFYLPSVVTVPGSRGELANALRLDLVIDDQFVNCAEIIAASPTKAVLMLRQPDLAMQQHASDRGIGVVTTLADALPVLEGLHELLPARRGRLLRLADWFSPKTAETLPHNPRTVRPLPEEDAGPSVKSNR